MTGTLIEVLIDLPLGPLRTLPLVALPACVGRTYGRRQRGLWQTESVIATIVEHHVRALGHVAIGTTTPLSARLVEVMLRCIVDRSLVAARAKGVAFRSNLRAVCIMAVAADDPGCVHLALQERSVDVHLVFDLTIVEVQNLIQGRQPIPIVVSRVFAAEVGSTRVTGSAGLGLGTGTRCQLRDVLTLLEGPDALSRRR